MEPCPLRGHFCGVKLHSVAEATSLQSGTTMVSLSQFFRSHFFFSESSDVTVSLYPVCYILSDGDVHVLLKNIFG